MSARKNGAVKRVEDAIIDVLRDPLERTKAIRELIRRFDVEFDMTLRHEMALGILMLFRPSARSTPDIDQFTFAVGEATCRILRADLAYRYLDALEAIEESRGASMGLRNAIRLQEEGETRSVARYALARWTDARAKIDFRFGDFSAAKRGFQEAVDLVDGSDWACLPDFQSNYIRADYEENRAAGRPASLVSETYGALIGTVTQQICERANRSDDPVGWAVVDIPLSHELREALRGLSSLLHNRAVALEAEGSPEGSLAESAKVVKIATGLSDQYRLAQALLHEGRLLADRGQLRDAVDRFTRVQKSPWGRGARIAQQWLSRLAADAGDFDEAVRGFRGIFDASAAARLMRGGDLGADLPFETATVEQFERALDTAEGIQPEAEIQGLRVLARMERLRSIRSMRRMVKVRSYKRDYARFVWPTFLREISLRLAERPALATDSTVPVRAQALRRQQHDDGILWLVEESSARELLDTLAANSAGEEDAVDRLAADTPASQGTTTARRAARTQEALGPPSASRRRARPAALSDEELAIVSMRREEYERRALERPIASVPIPLACADELRRFTIADESSVVVRYFHAQESAAAKRELYAFVSRHGRIDLCGPLSLDTVREIGWSFEEGPSGELARESFRCLVQPLLRATGPLGPTTRLVIVPSEELWGVPLHVASGAETEMLPLAAATGLCFSASLAAHVSRTRAALARFRVEHSDQLFALVDTTDGVSGAELLDVRWPRDGLSVAGFPPSELAPSEYRPVLETGSSLFRRISADRPEFLLYASHGRFEPRSGPLLDFVGSMFTPFDIAHSLKLVRNKLTILAACVSGTGVSEAGGEVAGFLRAFVAAGAGCIGMTLWNVLDGEISTTVGSLLQSAVADMGRQPFDVVRKLRELYFARCRNESSIERRAEMCPLVLYL